MNGNCDELAMTAQSMPPTTLEAIHQGKAIIDGGATKTMASVYALEKLSQANMNKRGESGVAKVDGHNRPIFGFGNSQESEVPEHLHHEDSQPESAYEPAGACG